MFVCDGLELGHGVRLSDELVHVDLPSGAQFSELVEVGDGVDALHGEDGPTPVVGLRSGPADEFGEVSRRLGFAPGTRLQGGPSEWGVGTAEVPLGENVSQVLF